MSAVSPLYLVQMEVGPMENFVYLIGDRAKGECVMVDPAWEVDRVLRRAEEDGMRVTGALVTHTHHDHVNGVEELLGRIDGRVYVHKNEAGRFKGMAGRIAAVDSGDRVAAGDIKITFIHTPGHTPGSQCFLVENRLVSGDTLFINACGRCDLPGGDAGQMYASLMRLAKLGDETILLPGHNYDPEPVSTLGKEKFDNPYYRCGSLSAFLDLRMGKR